MFLHLSLILFGGGGGGVCSVHPLPLNTDSPGCRPPDADFPPDGTPPLPTQIQTPPRDTVNKRAVCILLECILLGISNHNFFYYIYP